MATMHTTFLCDDPVADNLLAGALVLPTTLGLPAQSIGVNKGNLDVCVRGFGFFLVPFCLPWFLFTENGFPWTHGLAFAAQPREGCTEVANRGASLPVSGGKRARPPNGSLEEASPGESTCPCTWTFTVLDTCQVIVDRYGNRRYSTTYTTIEDRPSTIARGAMYKASRWLRWRTSNPWMPTSAVIGETIHPQIEPNWVVPFSIGRTLVGKLIQHTYN